LIAIAALMLAEYASRPIDLTIVPTSPLPVYADMTRHNTDNPTATLAEFPVSAVDDATYMYYSTFHWQHLLNGYSGFSPPSYRKYARAMETMPGAAAIQYLKRRETHYLIVHGERLYGGRYDQIVDEL